MYYNEFVKLGIDAPNVTQGKKKAICPKCNGGSKNEKSLRLYYESGYYQCHRATCGWRGFASKKKEYTRPEWKNNTTLPSRTVKWFEDRGISQKTLKSANVSVDEKGNIEFNYFRGTELINVKTRYEIQGNKTFKQVAGAEKIVYNYNSLEGKKKCIIVEGEIDVLSWIEAGVSKEYGIISVDQGAGVVGSNLGGKLDCIKTCAIELDEIDEFFICTDKDAPGVYLQTELARRLGEYRCSVIDLPKGIKDSNEVLQQKEFDKSARIQTLKLQLKNAKPVDVGGIYRLDIDTKETMLNLYDNGREKGKSTHFKKLDTHFTFLKGDVTLFTGIPGMGKSQFLRQLMVNKSYFDSWKWACFVPEDFPADYFFEDLVHIYTGQSSDKEAKDRVSKEDFISAMDFISDHFFLIYSDANPKTSMSLPDNKWINERIRFLKLKHGINAYVKDPWNKIAHNFQYREDQYLANELTAEGYFAKQFDAAIYVAHPVGTKIMKNKEGEYKVPGPYDISGGSMWLNMMDNILTVHRPNKVGLPNDRTVEIHVQKIRKKKVVGKEGAVDFFFDKYKSRYYEDHNSHTYNPMEDEGKSISDDEDLPF
ncbi:toprim domain-containing protein [Bernardetia sp.]|uniref:toprim domain-containing protein n=1 Tax=Bernardetia sp. TaxID=1937974 RepID=UPI0025C006DD|nr:toprim domain-containing protein [Bernardetia sp.]